MSVLDRAALEASPLADLHAIASELSIDGYRRLRRGELIDAILGGESAVGNEAEPAAETAPEPEQVTEVEDDRGEPRRARPRRTGRGRTGNSRPRREEQKPDGAETEAEVVAEDETVEGTVELLPNGSGFVRVQPPEPSDGDVYISAAQVKRCELVSGDRISGPRRAPRRSERFASLVRIDTINDRPADELAGSTRFDDLPAAFPTERFELGSDDPTIKAIEWLTPVGRGSRVTICGPSRAGKSETLRRLAGALAGHDGLQISVVLAGVRPEEIPEWEGSLAPAAAVSLASSADAQAHAIELVVDQARRMAARGSDAVVLIDTLEGLH
jgi:transcription termination factor Rho